MDNYHNFREGTFNLLTRRPSGIYTYTYCTSHHIRSDHERFKADSAHGRRLPFYTHRSQTPLLRRPPPPLAQPSLPAKLALCPHCCVPRTHRAENITKKGWSWYCHIHTHHVLRWVLIFFKLWYCGFSMHVQRFLGKFGRQERYLWRWMRGGKRVGALGNHDCWVDDDSSDRNNAGSRSCVGCENVKNN